MAASQAMCETIADEHSVLTHHLEPCCCSFLHIDPNLPATVEDDGSAGLPTLSQHNTRAQHLQRKGELKEGEEVSRHGRLGGTDLAGGGGGGLLSTC